MEVHKLLQVYYQFTSKVADKLFLGPEWKYPSLFLYCYIFPQIMRDQSGHICGLKDK